MVLGWGQVRGVLEVGGGGGGSNGGVGLGSGKGCVGGRWWC